MSEREVDILLDGIDNPEKVKEVAKETLLQVEEGRAISFWDAFSS